MALVISSKGKDVTTWRAAEEFALGYRDILRGRTVSLLSDQSEMLFADVDRDLQLCEDAHETGLARLRLLVSEAATAGTPDRLRTLVEQFYAECYKFFDRNHSAIAFFHLSAEFLEATSATLVGYSKLHADLPVTLPVAVISLNSAGRREFSPLCRLQMLLVHGEPVNSAIIEGFGHILHKSFQTAGLLVDMQITPKNPAWCGSITAWRQRLTQQLEQGRVEQVNDFSLLVDQTALFSDPGLAHEFKSCCLQLLVNSRSTMAALVTRMMGLTTGLGMMGRFRLEKRGPHRGQFGLLDYALVPLSAAVSTLALLNGVNEAETPKRIRDLLAHGELDVEMAERLLEAWHLFNEFRLEREVACLADPACEDAGFVDVLAGTGESQERLKESLDTVSTLQRHIGISFNGFKEQI